MSGDWVKKIKVTGHVLTSTNKKTWQICIKKKFFCCWRFNFNRKSTNSSVFTYIWGILEVFWILNKKKVRILYDFSSSCNKKFLHSQISSLFWISSFAHVRGKKIFWRFYEKKFLFRFIKILWYKNFQCLFFSLFCL